MLHGTSDDNADFFHSLKLVNARLRAGRQQFEFVPLSGFTHLVADPLVMERVLRLEVDFLKAHLGYPASRVPTPDNFHRDQPSRRVDPSQPTDG